MLEHPLDTQLRTTKESNLAILFEFQTDVEAGYLAAFMPENPFDKVAYFSKYSMLLIRFIRVQISNNKSDYI